jgi:hypothetical protein
MKLISIIHDVCCDDRIKDGILRLENPEHVFVLQEYLEKAGYNINEIVAKTAKLFAEGRFPDRQAYNKDGILVTFPSTEYRARAVDKGTHFAENPKKTVGKLFSPSDTGDLSTSDVSTDPTNTDAIPKKKSDTVSLDQELNKKVAGDVDIDNRSTKDKVQDAEAVQSILTNTTPLLNYSVDEAIRYGFYNKGFNWYDCDGNLLGEQIYDDLSGQVMIQAERTTTNETKPAPAGKFKSTELEFQLAKELNSYAKTKKFVTQNATAQILAKSLVDKYRIKSCIALGDTGCKITNPLFAQIKDTSKTDLILVGNTAMRTSLKDTGAQGCSAQNREVNAIITTVLQETGESQQTMESVSSFIMDGIGKSFYVPLQDEVKRKLQKSLTKVIDGKSIDSIKKDIASVESIIKTNKDYVINGEIPLDMTMVLAKINEVFNQPEKRYMFIEEMLTGKRRFRSGATLGSSEPALVEVVVPDRFRSGATLGSSEPSPQCVADYMMTWNREGNYHLHTVQDFIDNNQNNITFRFANRGGVRGISIRSDLTIKLANMFNESILDEGFFDILKQAGASITQFFGDFNDEIKLLVGEAKAYFTKVYESIKSGLESIYETILKFGRFLKEIIKAGWATFADWVGIESEATGTWNNLMPTSSSSVSEQVYDDSIGKSIIQIEIKESVVPCEAKTLEYHLGAELNNKNTNNTVAKKIADNIKKNDGVKSCEIKGNQGCPIVDPLFNMLNKTSKTDLVFKGKKRMKASLKQEVSQICSAQNAEVNAVVSSVLKHTGESTEVMEGVSSFIMDGIQKSFYIGLQAEVKDKLNKAMTAVIQGGQGDSTDPVLNALNAKLLLAQVAEVEKIIKTNKDYVLSGKIPVDMTKTLITLNSVFMQPNRRYMLIEELATGKRRFADGEGKFNADCIADYMMTWNCDGQYSLYTVEQFLRDNDKNISFRFSNRGGIRGVAIRGDFKLDEIVLDEAITDTLKNIGRSLTNFFGDFTDKIKLLVGEAKVYFTKVLETIKAELQSIYESILKFGRFLKALIQQGWEVFANIIGLEGQADGGWRWRMPGTSSADMKLDEPTNV